MYPYSSESRGHQTSLGILLFFALALIASPGIVLAQSGAGSIQGTITDSSGAVIPKASIQVVNQETGVASKAATNGVGFYQVPGLFTGNYVVTITAPRMETFIQKLSCWWLRPR